MGGRVMKAAKSLIAAVLLSLLPTLAAAQAPPQSKAPGTPEKDVHDPQACAQGDVTTGQGDHDVRTPPNKTLSDRLAQSKGVICPPEHVDPQINKPAPGGGAMPVIPPPGPPGGNPNVEPK